MATVIEIYGMYEYPNVVRHVVNEGKARAPRNEPTLDAGHVTVVLHDPTQGLAVGCGRGLSPRVAAAEAVQLIGGFHDPDLMVWASPNFEAFQDEPGQPFHGAYGNRIGNQLAAVRRKLDADPHTRQAVINLWDPTVDNDPGHRDYPCTIALGFSITEAGFLDMNVLMRSNDVWLGFPYDVFQFTQLQLTLWRVLKKTLDVKLGQYTHTAWSLHFYERDYAHLHKLRIPYPEHRTFQPQGFTHGAPEGLVYGAILYDEATESEKWYHDQFTGYRQARANAAAELGRHVVGGS